MSNLYRDFSTETECQTWCNQQTTLANLPSNGVTTVWSEPMLLTNGTYIAQAFNDSAAIPWQSG